jgi:hypothetical protein
MVLPDAPAEEPSSHGEADAPGAEARWPSPWGPALWLLAGAIVSALLWAGAWRAETGRAAVLRALAAMAVLLVSLAAFLWRCGWCPRRHSDQREVEQTSASSAGACASEPRQLLDQLAVSAGSDPWWGSRFWQAVAAKDAQGTLDAAVKAGLQSRGYIGANTAGAPDVPTIEAMLLPCEAMGGAPFAGGFTSSGLAAVSNVDSWAHSLPPDFKRAAGEIYRNIRAAGSTSVRHWLQVQHTGSKHGAEWQHLWAMASMVDFAVGHCQSDTELYTRLISDDQLELSLRHLSAHVYEQRTRDYVGGARLRAVVAPGSSVDIAPNWLISEATLHSKMEHQREERVHAELRRRAGRGDGHGKGDRKGKDKTGGRGR